MKLLTHIKYARSHIIFILGVISSIFLIFELEKNHVYNSSIKSLKSTYSNTLLRPHSPLSKEEVQWAKIAWKYFENNTITSTGLVNSVDQYNASTLWDTSSYLMALLSAYKINIIGQTEFDDRLTSVLSSLAQLPLFNQDLPNKSYNTITLSMADYNNKNTDLGIGWSAIDIGRVMVPLQIIAWTFPNYQPLVKNILSRWNFKMLLKGGQMHGAKYTDGEVHYVQEGRLGYEEYAAKSFQLIGLDVSQAMNYLDYINIIEIDNIDIVTDSRDPQIYTAHNYVVSEPYILDGIEYGWDVISKELAYRVYSAQKNRYLRTGILTAVSEDNIDQAPYFVYNTVFTDGSAWNTITEQGEDASKFKSLSTKAVFGWYVLYKDEYVKKLINKASTLYDPKKGWYSGFYENLKRPNKAITANTNGIILQSLAYKQFGPLLQTSFKHLVK